MLAVDLAEAMLERLCAAHGCGGPLGNEPGVRPWLGDMENVIAYQVPETLNPRTRRCATQERAYSEM